MTDDTHKPCGYVSDDTAKCLAEGLSGFMTVSEEQNDVYTKPIYLAALSEPAQARAKDSFGNDLIERELVSIVLRMSRHLSKDKPAAAKLHDGALDYLRRKSLLPSPLRAEETVAQSAEPTAVTQLVGEIVPPHCSGSALAFEPGVLHVNKDGSGYIAINEEDFVVEDDRCEGPDGPEGSIHWIARMDASEIIALRDFLNGNTTADRLADKIEDLISEFGDNPKVAIECVSEHLSLCRHAIRARAVIQTESREDRL